MIGYKQDETIDHLLAQVCRLHHARARMLFHTMGLYRGQPPLLHALWERDGLTQTELAELLRVTPATITKSVQRLERTGFVVRKADPEDQRVSRVWLTDAGRAVHEDIQAAFRTMAEEIMAGLGMEERTVLKRLLAQIRDNLRSAAGDDEPPPCEEGEPPEGCP